MGCGLPPAKLSDMVHGSGGSLDHPIAVRLHRTRSSAEYSLFAIAPVASGREFNLGELVKLAVRGEGLALEPDPRSKRRGTLRWRAAPKGIRTAQRAVASPNAIL